MAHRSDKMKPLESVFSIGETLTTIMTISNAHDAMKGMIIHAAVEVSALDQFEIQILVAAGVYAPVVWKRGQYIRPVAGGVVISCLSDMTSIPAGGSSWVEIRTSSFAELRIQAASSLPAGSTGTIWQSGAVG